MDYKSNYTNLKETYMYNGDWVSSRDKFYKYSKNNENSIDDPIFTGFTFSLDTMHSPLFYNCDFYESKMESLRDPNAKAGTKTVKNDDGTEHQETDNQRLCAMIEKQLEKTYKIEILGTPESYELNTIMAKDSIGQNGRLAGYGLQDKVYLDNINYGAVEYIYMVDKVSDGMFNDVAGKYDVGNGSPNIGKNSTYDKVLDEISELENLYKKDKNAEQDKIIKDAEKEHENNVQLANEDYAENTSEICDEYDTEIENLEKELDDISMEYIYDVALLKNDLKEAENDIMNEAEEEFRDRYDMGFDDADEDTIEDFLNDNGYNDRLETLNNEYNEEIYNTQDEGREVYEEYQQNIQAKEKEKQQELADAEDIRDSLINKSEQAKIETISEANEKKKDISNMSPDDVLKALQGEAQEKMEEDDVCSEHKLHIETVDNDEKSMDISIINQSTVANQANKLNQELTAEQKALVEELEKAQRESSSAYRMFVASEYKDSNYGEKISEIYSNYFTVDNTKIKAEYNKQIDEIRTEKNNLEKTKEVVINLDKLLDDLQNKLDNLQNKLDNLHDSEGMDKHTKDGSKYKDYGLTCGDESDSGFKKFCNPIPDDIIAKEICVRAYKMATASFNFPEKGLKKDVKTKLVTLNATLKMAQDKTNEATDKYRASKKIADTDTYSKVQAQKEHYEYLAKTREDALKYKEYQAEKESSFENSMQSKLPTVDRSSYTNDVKGEMVYNQALQKEMEKARSENQRKLSEAPQTVYDLLQFASGMKKLTEEYPYILSEISGLDEAYKKYFNMKEPHQGSGDDKITISCYESVDLRVSSMFNRYFNAAYDHQYKRERLPVNLRRFQCSVFVHDIRNFREALSTLDSKFALNADGDSVSKIVEMALNYVSAIEFKFYDCEIVPEETGSIFDTLSNESGGDMKKTNFTFTYGNCVINFLPFADIKEYFEPVSSPATQNEGGSQEKKGLLARLAEKYGNSNNNSEDSGDGNFRRWFDRSELGNVNNNDYQDYIREDSSVAVDDMYKTSIVNNFAVNSLSQKNKDLTEMDNALKRSIIGISASSGIPVKGVTDALNISNIYEYINNGDGSEMPVIKDLGNINASKRVISSGGTNSRTANKEIDLIEDLGMLDKPTEEPKIVKSIGNTTYNKF